MGFERWGGKPRNDVDNLLNNGLPIASKGQEGLLKEPGEILECYDSFSVQKVSEKGEKSELLNESMAMEISLRELEDGMKKELMEKTGSDSVISPQTIEED